MDAYLQADPKLQEYYSTLNPDDRILFEEMVKNELRTTTIGNQDSRMNAHQHEYQDSYVDRSNVSSQPADFLMNGKSTNTYRQQLDEAARQPAITSERFSLHNQRLLKQKQAEARENSSLTSMAPSASSILSIGTTTSRSGSGAGSPFITARNLDPTEVSDRQKKLLAQQTYARQLQEDSRVNRGTPLGNRTTYHSTNTPIIGTTQTGFNTQGNSHNLGSSNRLRDQAIRNITNNYASGGLQAYSQSGHDQWESRNSESYAPIYSIPGLPAVPNTNCGNDNYHSGQSNLNQMTSNNACNTNRGFLKHRGKAVDEESHVLGSSVNPLYLLGGGKSTHSVASGRGRSSGGGVSTLTLC